MFFFSENNYNKNRTIVGSSGSLTSPLFPKKYPENFVSVTTLQAPELSRIVIALDLVDIEDQQECLYDFLKFDAIESNYENINQAKDRRHFTSNEKRWQKIGEEDHRHFGRSPFPDYIDDGFLISSDDSREESTLTEAGLEDTKLVMKNKKSSKFCGYKAWQNKRLDSFIFELSLI